ncbi:MAG: CBS domain-containing protein [Candidatus Brocadiales bacterium]
MKNLKARDLMTRPVVSARESASARDVAMQLLCGLYSGMPVTNQGGEVVGVVTEHDLLKAVKAGKELVRITAGDVMTREAITVDVDTPVEKIADILMDKNIIRVPVTQDGKLTGVVSRCDILRSFLEPEFITHM